MNLFFFPWGVVVIKSVQVRNVIHIEQLNFRIALETKQKRNEVHLN